MNNEKSWTIPKRFPHLMPNETHVWLTSLNIEKSPLTNLWNLLTTTEKARAEQFKFSKLKRRFIVSQGTLRLLLGKYLKIKPESIIFERSKYGKPYVKNLSTNIKFNLSHAHNFALFAFSLKHEVGVDIELVRKNFIIDEISQRFFHPSETKSLLALPKTRRPAAFFNCWVKKEAFIKAIGLGLFYALNKFKINFSTNQTMLHVGGKQQKSSWSVQALPAPRGYRAAIVNEGKIMRIKRLMVNIPNIPNQ